jgi:Rieske 2Fe-2S family protein
MQDLHLYKRIAYDIKANWKLLVQNYNECLHCPLLHPALNQLTEYLGADNEPPAETYIGGAMSFRNGAQTMSLTGRCACDPLPFLTEVERKKVCYYAIYPNLLLSLHPDYMMLHTLWPLAVDRTRVICEWHFHPSQFANPLFNGDDAVDFWDRTNREDWNIVELSQAGIQSRAYTPGPYSPRESLLVAFDQFILTREREARGV